MQLLYDLYLWRICKYTFKKENKHKKLEKIFLFVGVLKVTDEKNRIRRQICIQIRPKMSRIRNTGGLSLHISGCWGEEGWPEPAGGHHQGGGQVPLRRIGQGIPVDPSVQGCGSVSGSGLDPDSIGSVDPDSGSGSGSRREKWLTKVENFLKNSCFEVLDGLYWELKASSVTWTFFVEA
jgi:hypothetical protein